MKWITVDYDRLINLSLVINVETEDNLDLIPSSRYQVVFQSVTKSKYFLSFRRKKDRDLYYAKLEMELLNPDTKFYWQEGYKPDNASKPLQPSVSTYKP